MAWLAADKDGTEWIYRGEPVKNEDKEYRDFDAEIKLPEGSIKKLIGRELTFDDEPAEIK